MTETALAAVPAHPTRPAAPAGKRALGSVPVEDWTALMRASAETNAFFDPGFALPAAEHARGTGATDALCAYNGKQLIGFVPVSSALRSYGLPIPALASAQPYTVLGTPLLQAEQAALAADRLLDAAGASGAHVLSLHMVDLEGTTMTALREAAARRGLGVMTYRGHDRAALAVPEDAEAYLRAGMGSKKLKELRRQRHRLDEEGAVEFAMHRGPAAVEAALGRFLALEAEGWKGARGTGLGQDDGDTRFVTKAAATLSARGSFEIFEMTLTGATIAIGLILRQRETALFFKVAYDEAFARFSPGVQLTVELTRHFVEDPEISFVDSAALPGHPMIDHVWRERRHIGNVLIATRRGPVAAACMRLIMARDGLREAAKRALHATKSALKTREKSK
jgi:CelD/BcsL family acetyltransferase involved in cellulose biosynthesis